MKTNQKSTSVSLLVIVWLAVFATGISCIVFFGEDYSFLQRIGMGVEVVKDFLIGTFLIDRIIEISYPDILSMLIGTMLGFLFQAFVWGILILFSIGMYLLIGFLHDTKIHVRTRTKTLFATVARVTAVACLVSFVVVSIVGYRTYVREIKQPKEQAEVLWGSHHKGYNQW